MLLVFIMNIKNIFSFTQEGYHGKRVKSESAILTYFWITKNTEIFGSYPEIVGLNAGQFDFEYGVEEKDGFVTKFILILLIISTYFYSYRYLT